MTEPLLRIGAFGTHLITGSTGYCFVGEVPTTIQIGPYSSEAEGIKAFVVWFKAQDLEFQRQHVGNLRNDVFTTLLTF